MDSQSVLNEEVNYFQLPRKSVLKSTPKTFRINPTAQPNEFTYRDNRKIKFLLPSNGFLDTKNTTLQFYADTKNKTSIRCCFNNFIECIFNQLDIKLGNGRLLESIRQYNLLAVNKMKFENSQDYNRSIGKNLMGIDDYENRLVNSESGRNYSVKLVGSGIMNECRFIPLGLLARVLKNSFPLEMELTLENPAVCCSSKAVLDSISGLNYQVKNAYLLCDIYEDLDYEEKLFNSLDEQGLNMVYNSNKYYQDYLDAGRIGDIVYNIPDYSVMCNGLRTMFFTATDDPSVEKTNVYSRPSGQVEEGGLREYQFKVGDRYYPTNPITLGGKYLTAYAFNELVKYLGKDKLTDGCCGFDTKFSAWAKVNYIDTTYDNDSVLSIDQNSLITNSDFKLIEVGVGNYRIVPPQSGNYSLNVDFEYIFGSQSPPNFETTEVSIEFYKDGDLSEEVISLKHTTNLDIANADAKSASFSTIVNLERLEDEGYTLFLSKPILDGLASIRNLSLNLKLIDDPESGYYTSDFTIGQSFKKHHDENDCNFITGVDVGKNQLNFRIRNDTADTKDYVVSHFLEYQNMLTITKNDVDIKN